MFEAFKKNIQSVQDGISAGFQRLSVGDRSSTTPTEPPEKVGAGSELLELYQTQWATMHHMAKQNGELAEKVDHQITNLVEECEGQHNKVVEIHSLLAHLPNIMSQLHSTLATIGCVRGLFEEVEGELLALQDLTEELSLQERTLDLRMSLALAREKHNYKLNAIKNDLSLSYKARLQSFEKEQEIKRKTKVDRLNNQFKEDVRNFQTQTKPIGPSRSSSSSGLRLEDVDLEEDKGNLESFLEEPA